MIHILDKSKCCGCWACVQRCPKQCITMQEDNEGFLYPEVDKKDCIDCGLCEKVCPMINIGKASLPEKVFAAKCKDEKTRLSSSSGGMFFTLAKAVIQENGVVFGATYDESWGVRISYAEQIDGVFPMMGSKYLQSTVGTAYQDAERFLKQGRKVLFSGTPCQIAGLHTYLRKEYDNLLSVDFLCHGVPSPGVWKRYLSETCDLLSENLRHSHITGVEFRNKEACGWKRYSFVIRADSDSIGRNDSVLLSDIHYENPYMKGFLGNLYLRPSCYECRCKEGVNHSDLTIADFWGVHDILPSFDDDKGVSLVLVYTSKGYELFNQLALYTQETSLDEAINRNEGYSSHAQWNPMRPVFFKAFNKGNETISHMVTRLLHRPLWRRIAGKGKSMILELYSAYFKCK